MSMLTIVFVISMAFATTVDDDGVLYRLLILYRSPKKEMNVGWLILCVMVLPLIVIGVMIFVVVYLLEIVYRVGLEPVLSIKLFKGE